MAVFGNLLRVHRVKGGHPLCPLHADSRRPSAFAVEDEHSPQALGRSVQKNPAGSRPPGGYCDARSGTRHLDPHHVLKDSFQTAEDSKLVDLLGHLLQGLQLLQSQQGWVLIHQPRGVQQ